MKFFAAATIGALAFGASAFATAAPNLLINGSFESGLASWSTTGFVLSGYDYGIDDAAQTGAAAFFGGAVGTIGYLQQSLATTEGQTYGIDLWLASDGYLPNRFQVLANGQILLDVEDVLLQPYGAMHADFTAVGSSTQLAFGFRNDSGSLHLDNVTVSAVAEPSSALLAACGLGVLGWFVRHARRDRRSIGIRTSP